MTTILNDLYKHSYDEKFNFCTYFSSVSQCSFSAFWQAEIAISPQPQINQQVVCSTHLFLKIVLIFIFTVNSVYLMLIPHNMFSSDLLHDECLS